MNPNPFLHKLGCSNNDRLVILHTDDIGMCQDSVQAFQDLWASGTISSGATMVPCSWFPAVARMCGELKNFLESEGIHVIGYRAIREAMQNN